MPMNAALYTEACLSWPGRETGHGFYWHRWGSEHNPERGRSARSAWAAGLGRGLAQLRLWTSTADTNALVRDDMRRYYREHPRLDDIAYHTGNMPHGFEWVGRYYPVQNRRNSSGYVATDDSGNPIGFDCAHCAALAAMAMDRAGGHVSPLIIGCEGGEVDPVYFPPCGELVGSEVPLNTATTKNANRDEVNRSCSNCGLSGHNSRTCERPEKSHDRIGIEIEGRWLDLRVVKEQASAAGLSGDSDGSLRGSPDSEARPWEFRTDPGSLTQAVKQLIDFYPDETDSHCGMHVHMSFKSITHVAQLATKGFFDYFVARWTAWGERNNLHPRGQFFSRLKGLNDYCNLNHEDEVGDDNTITSTDRYRQINFSSWERHKTVEFRLLPMFIHSGLAVSAVVELVTLIEDWLGLTAGNVLTMPETDVMPGDAGVTSITSAEAFAMDIHSMAPHVDTTVGRIEVPTYPEVRPGMTRVVPPPGAVRDFLLNLASNARGAA